MWGLVRAKLPIDADEFEWMLACFRWFEQEFGAMDRLRPDGVTLPGSPIFETSRASGHARAVELFDIVRERAGMADWQCDLLPGERARESSVSTGLALRHLGRNAPLGTFAYADGRYRITYDPSELERPASLVATFAHELAHYLLHTARTPPPGGRELEEHATDLAAVYLGFGVFLANSAKTFRQFQDFGEQGWEMRPQGYLSELALTTGLALFVRLSGVDPLPAERALKDYLRRPFRNAGKAIDREYPDIGAAMNEVDLSDW